MPTEIKTLLSSAAQRDSCVWFLCDLVVEAPSVSASARVSEPVPSQTLLLGAAPAVTLRWSQKGIKWQTFTDLSSKNFIHIIP